MVVHTIKYQYPEEVEILDMDEKMRKLLALVAMVVIGAVVLVIAGEVAKYVIPHEALYFLLINKVYFLAAAIFLLLLGIDKINMNSARNLSATFVLIVIGVVLLWLLDKAASGMLWGGMYPSVYGRIPAQYVTLFLQALDIIAIALGALGGFLVLLKAMDKIKDMLNGATKIENKEKEI